MENIDANTISQRSNKKNTDLKISNQVSSIKKKEVDTFTSKSKNN